MFINTVNNGLALHNIDAEAHSEMGWIQAENSEPGSPIIINADTLGGVPAENYALKEDLDQLFTSVSEGKSLIAAAVTDKGVETAADATFQQMANNIFQIESGAELADVTITDDYGISEIYYGNKKQSIAGQVQAPYTFQVPIPSIIVVFTFGEAGSSLKFEGDIQNMNEFSRTGNIVSINSSGTISYGI